MELPQHSLGGVVPSSLNSTDVNTAVEIDVDDEVNFLDGCNLTLKNLATNDYETKIDLAEVGEVLALADKTVSSKMFCVFRHWMSFKKGYVYVVKIRDPKNKLSSEDNYTYQKLVMTRHTKVGTQRVSVPWHKKPRKGLKTRGGGAQRSSPSKDTKMTVNRTLHLTWSRYLVKAVLRDFCEYIALVSMNDVPSSHLCLSFLCLVAMDSIDEAMQWVQSEEAADILGDIDTLPRPDNIYLPDAKRRSQLPRRFSPTTPGHTEDREEHPLHEHDTSSEVIFPQNE